MQPTIEAAKAYLYKRLNLFINISVISGLFSPIFCKINYLRNSKLKKDVNTKEQDNSSK